MSTARWILLAMSIGAFAATMVAWAIVEAMGGRA